MPAPGGLLRYLRAKGSVDARAVNPQVRESLTRALAERPEDRTLRVLELGGGSGGAFRLWMTLLAPFKRVEFTATDRDRGLLDAYREETHSWTGAVGMRCIGHHGDELRFQGGERVLDLRFRQVAAPEGLEEEEDGTFDLLLAQSFWDLVPPGTAFALGRRLLAPGGLFYGTLTFGGVTRFGPTHPLDRSLLESYHASMGGDRGGDPRAGERLLGEVRIPGSGFTELASGRSDWRVIPTDEGYPGDERFFLLTLLGFIEKELLAAPDIPPDDLDLWMHTRRRQLKNTELSFTARQQDLAARRDG